MTFRKDLTVLGMLMIAGCSSLWGDYYVDPDMGALCDAGVTGCQRSADCPSGLCIDVQLGPYTPGSCVPTEAIVYVDGDHCTPGAEYGMQGSPFCEVETAIATIPPPDQTLHIFQLKPAKNQYKGILVTHGNLALIGPWADPSLKGTQWGDPMASAAALIGDAAVHRTALAIQGSVELVVDGIWIRSIDTGKNTGYALNVENSGSGSKLTLRRTKVSGSSGYGINVSNGPCTFRMDRCMVKDSRGTGLFLSPETSKFTITNSLFAKNGIPDIANGVTLDGVSEGIFDHNTVIDNGPANRMGSHGGITCMRSQRISNSIVWQNSQSTDTQFSGGNSATNPLCLLHQTIVGDRQNENIKDGTNCSPGLDEQGRLTKELSACAIDAATDNPDRNLDYFGTRRPQGMHSDIGFHELVNPDQPGKPPCTP